MPDPPSKTPDPVPPPTVALVVNPLRRDRHEPRVIKRRKDCYTYMTKPREELRKALEITKITP